VFCPEGVQTLHGARVGTAFRPCLLPRLPRAQTGVLPRPAVAEALEAFPPDLGPCRVQPVPGWAASGLAKSRQIPWLAKLSTICPSTSKHYGVGLLEPCSGKCLKAAHNQAELQPLPPPRRWLRSSASGHPAPPLAARRDTETVPGRSCSNPGIARTLMGQHADSDSPLLVCRPNSRRKTDRGIRPVLGCQCPGPIWR